MSEEFRGRKRLSSSDKRSEIEKRHFVSPALPTPSAAPATPTHRPSGRDVEEQIQVFSPRADVWTEVTATFLDGLMEARISKDLSDRLKLDVTPKSPGDPDWGLLGKKSVALGGTTELQWFPNTRKKVKDTTCRIVDSKIMKIHLPLDLLSTSPLSVNKHSDVKNHSILESIPRLPVSPSPPIVFAKIDVPPELEKGLKIDSVTLKESDHESSSAGSIGSFDGIQETISETSKEAKYADDWMNMLKESFHKHLPKNPDIVHDPVKIAVLDTGIDTTESFIKGAVKCQRVKFVKSFVDGDSSATDEFGHGTHVASLLLRVAPRAKVFVLKIAKTEKIQSTKSIADAINHAANELRVDIITMSFGLDSEIAEVQEAIRNAFSRKVLMFAAASNSGGNNEVKYPARKDEVTCVYATDGSGNAFTKNPNTMPTTALHFATLGVGVKSSWPTKLHDPPLRVGEASERRQTGTSFATPIVAGIAACIMEFAIVQDLPEDLLTVLKTRQGMQKTLLKLMVDDTLRSGLHYIHPWKMFANKRTEVSVVHAMTDILRS